MHTKVELRSSLISGRGVFAVELITPGETVARFDGPFYDRDYPAWTP